MYLGVVGLVSRERRQSIVYLGGQLSGTLPMGPDDRGPDIGARIPVRIEALGNGPEGRPQLSAVLTVPGPIRSFEHVPCGTHKQADYLGEGARERLRKLAIHRRPTAGASSGGRQPRMQRTTCLTMKSKSWCGKPATCGSACRVPKPLDISTEATSARRWKCRATPNGSATNCGRNSCRHSRASQIQGAGRRVRCHR